MKKNKLIYLSASFLSLFSYINLAWGTLVEQGECPLTIYKNVLVTRTIIANVTFKWEVIKNSEENEEPYEFIMKQLVGLKNISNVTGIVDAGKVQNITINLDENEKFNEDKKKRFIYIQRMPTVSNPAGYYMLALIKVKQKGKPTDSATYTINNPPVGGDTCTVTVAGGGIQNPEILGNM